MSTISDLFASDPESGDRPGDFCAAVLAALILLEKTFYSTSAPASPVNGNIWIDPTDPTRLIGKLRQNGAWALMVLTHILEQNLDFDLNEAVNFKGENLGTPPTPSAGAESQLYYNTSIQEYQFVTDSAVKTILSTETGATEKGINLQLPSQDQLFDDTGDSAALYVVVPDGWDGVNDPTLELWCSLEQTETAADEIDWVADVRAITAGDSRNKTITTTARSDTSIGANVDSGDAFACSVVIDYDDATNPVTAGDLLEVLIRRPDLAEVGAVKLMAARALFKGGWDD